MVREAAKIAFEFSKERYILHLGVSHWSVETLPPLSTAPLPKFRLDFTSFFAFPPARKAVFDLDQCPFLFASNLLGSDQ
jgi:hypothetical protein